MSYYDSEYDPIADYDMDGEVDDFERGLFLHEMEEEDREIEEGHAFFGNGGSSYEPVEDYIGLDLESCTIMDPDYDGSESLDELASRYGIELTKEDVEFYRESQETHVTTTARKATNPAKVDAKAQEIIDDFLLENSPEYRKSVQEAEARRKFEARGERVEALESWKRHAPKEDLAKYRDRKWRYIGEWALAIGIVLLFLSAPIAWMWVLSDDADAGLMTVFCIVLMGVIIGFAIKIFGPSLGASERAYKRDVETIIIVSNENERQRAIELRGKDYQSRSR